MKISSEWRKPTREEYDEADTRRIALRRQLAELQQRERGQPEDWVPPEDRR